MLDQLYHKENIKNSRYVGRGVVRSVMADILEYIKVSSNFSWAIMLIFGINILGKGMNLRISLFSSGLNSIIVVLLQG